MNWLMILTLNSFLFSSGLVLALENEEPTSLPLGVDPNVFPRLANNYWCVDVTQDDGSPLGDFKPKERFGPPSPYEENSRDYPEIKAPPPQSSGGGLKLPKGLPLSDHCWIDGKKVRCKFILNGYRLE